MPKILYRFLVSTESLRGFMTKYERTSTSREKRKQVENIRLLAHSGQSVHWTEKENVKEVRACEVGTVEGSSIAHGAFKGLFISC